MNSHPFARVIGCVTVAMFLAIIAVKTVSAQTTDGAMIEGVVCDLQHQALAAADIIAISESGNLRLSAKSDADGKFHLALPAGTYSVSVSLPGWRDSKRQISLASGQRFSVQFLLEKVPSSGQTSPSSAGEFSDAPNYIVSGVTDPTNLGGHGSDTVVRTKESLAKATASLNNADIAREKQRVGELQKGPDSAEIHELLGDIAESEGRPLEAVGQYQKAAAMAPTEANLFALGAELLLHGAAEPAERTFIDGEGRYPFSVRLALGRAAAVYVLGREDEAAKLFAAACDVQPANAEPYLFLGRLQASTKSEPAGWSERLARYATANPTNAIAQYNYAVALSKETDPEAHAALIESLLRKSLELDPKFGAAYLQLGVFYATRDEFRWAIPEYQKAIANTVLPDEAHFRLAEAYRHAGQPEKAKEEIQLYSQISKEKSQQTQEERNKIPQFVYTLRDSPKKP
jgi:tetratricopeptide (TPR) repeat protein